MHKSFFGRHALLVLAIVFFSIPFALRGSRYAVQRMKNDVKDWLPTDFPETHELDWFRKRFLGEQFVVISWDGCHGNRDDVRFQKFVDNLFPEIPPSLERANQAAGVEPVEHWHDDLYTRSFMPERADLEDSFVGNKLLLKYLPKDHYDWAGKKEKWMRSGKNNWVYITPKGELYQWKGNQTWPAQLWRGITRLATGSNSVEGNTEIVADLGLVDGPWYYEDPSRLNARLVKSVTSGPSVLSQMTDEESQLDIGPAEAHDRLRGVLFGPDDKQTCVVVTLTEAAKDDPRGLVGRGMLGRERGFLLDAAEKAGLQAPRPPPAVPGFLAGLFPNVAPADERPLLRLGGPPVDNAAIDEEGQVTLARLLGLSLAVGLGLSWVCFRSINITIMVFLVGGFSAVTSVGIIYWTGSQLDAVLMSMPSLVYVLGISGAVHVVNYYRESVSDVGMSDAPDNAVKLGFWPCTMAAFTTSLGLMSLATSNIVPIKKFGCYAAIGVIATLLLLFTYLPAALEMWPPRRYLKRTAKQGDQDPSSAIERFLDRFWQAVGRYVIGNYWFVKFSCLALLIVGAIGLTRINTSVQLLKLFDQKAKIIEDYEWLEGNLGKLVPMELVVCIKPEVIDPSTINVELEEAVNNADQLFAEPKPEGLSFLERMEISKKVADELDRIYGSDGLGIMSRPMTANTFAPTEGIMARARQHYSDQLEASQKDFVDHDFLRVDAENKSELWRVSLRLAALDDIDFGDFVQQVQRVVEPIMLAYESRQFILQRKRGPEIDADFRPNFFCVATATTFDKQLTPEELQTIENVDDVPVNQSIIYWRHLHQLLKLEGMTPVKGYISKAEDLRHVKPTDVLVVLDDVAGINKQQLDDIGCYWLDARNHEFDPRAEATANKVRQDNGEIGQNVSVVYTGLVPIVYKAQTTLLTSLIQSTGLAFVMIAVVMVFLLRSAKAGLLAMLPNVFPVVAIFGAMGWMDQLVDIGSMMTASVAMGVAVDDTIHFLSWFRRGLDEGRSRNDAILLAYRRVATAMTQTTAIGGVGLSIFAFSTFTPTQMFGTLMLTLLAAALVGDLLFLPALLASPLGRMFDRDRTSRTANQAKDAVSHSPASGPKLDQNLVARASSPSSILREDQGH